MITIDIDFKECPACKSKNLQLNSKEFISKIVIGGYYPSTYKDAGKEYYISAGNQYTLKCLSCNATFKNHPIILKILEILQEKIKVDN